MSTENDDGEHQFSQMQGPSHAWALQMQGDTRHIDLVLFMFFTSLYSGDIFNHSVSFRFVSGFFVSWFTNTLGHTTGVDSCITYGRLAYSVSFLNQQSLYSQPIITSTTLKKTPYVSARLVEVN